MFDRSGRSSVAAARREDEPGPGAYSPVAPGRRTRAALAPFSTGAPRDGIVRRPGKEPAAMQYLGHTDVPLRGAAVQPQSFMTTAVRFAADAPRSSVRIKGGKVVVLAPRTTPAPGPGQYDVPAAVASMAAGGAGSAGAGAAKFGVAARPTTAPAAPRTDADGRPLAWTNVHRNPPSIPSTLDYGYEFQADGSLVPQKPPPERVPATTTPGPTSYKPDPLVTSGHARQPVTVAYSKSRTRRLEGAPGGGGGGGGGGGSAPGPGSYDPAPAPFRLPSARLPSSVFASKARKGIEAVIGRTATGARVGPGSHLSHTTGSGFRPHTASHLPVHHFGTTQARFTSPDADAAPPGPGAYSMPSSTSVAAAAAAAQHARLDALLARRMGAAAERFRSSLSPARAGGRSHSAGPLRRARGDGGGGDGGDGGDGGYGDGGDGSDGGSALRDVPEVPVFFSSATRFAPPPPAIRELPGVGTYNVGSELGAGVARDSGIPPVYDAPVSVEATVRGASGGAPRPVSGFSSTTSRFTSGAAGGAALAVAASTTPAVGPGSYVPDVVLSDRARARAAKPSPAFLTHGDRALPTGDKNLTGDTFLAYETRGRLGVASRAQSAASGRYMALSPGRTDPPPREVPGPGAYNLAPPPLPVLASDAAKVRFGSAGGGGGGGAGADSTAAAAGGMSIAALAGAAQRAHVMVTSAPRFIAHPTDAPGPGEYDPDIALGGRTKRTFNVSLAASEARAIMRSILPVRPVTAGAALTASVTAGSLSHGAGSGAT